MYYWIISNLSTVDEVGDDLQREEGTHQQTDVHHQAGHILIRKILLRLSHAKQALEEMMPFANIMSYYNGTMNNVHSLSKG